MRIVVETDQTIVGCSMPQEGEVWLRVDTGMLYEMRDWSKGGDSPACAPHRRAHRVGAPETHYGCDPSVFVALFDQEVKEGRWMRVMNATLSSGQ